MRATTRIAFVLVLVLGFGFAAAPAAADDDFVSFDVRAGAWYGVMGGSVRYPVTFPTGIPGVPAPTGRISTDLEDDYVLPYIDARLKILFVEIEAEGWYGEFEDETKIDTTFTLDGVTFGAATPIRTEADILSIAGRVRFVLPIPLVEVGIDAGARYMRADGKVEGNDPVTGAPVSEEGRAEFPIPQIGASAKITLFDFVEAYARVRGMAITYENYRLENFEFEIGGAVSIGDHFSVGLEYRLFVLSGDDNNDDNFVPEEDRANVDLRLQGLMLFGRVRF